LLLKVFISLFLGKKNCQK